jgi:2-hydroxy-6-oxonona-2,4-dienedioate hydrolase
MKTGKHQWLRRLGWLAMGFVVIVGGLAMFVYARFRHDMGEARERVASESLIANTACGIIEYADEGSGIPVLVIHGSGGGYDQGLLFGRILGGSVRVIAPSRFGYLNTPYPDDPSVTAQADTYVCLLDYLGIERAAVMAVSAGGTSALQFAQRHPERVESLVMVSAVSNVRPVREVNEGTQAALLTDFVYWAAVTTAPNFVLEFFGLSRDAQAGLAPEEVARARSVLTAMNPLGLRTAGLDHDSIEDNLFAGATFDLEAISAPALVVHARDDSFIPPVHADYTAEHIPGAQLVMFDNGGHFVLCRNEAITAISDFIQRAHQGGVEVAGPA